MVDTSESGAIIVILMTLFLLQHMAGCNDVTTIYRFNYKSGASDVNDNNLDGLVEIHARTDAFGMPFFLPNGSLIYPNVGHDIPGLIPESESQPGWKMNNWEPRYTDQRKLLSEVKHRKEAVDEENWIITKTETLTSASRTSLRIFPRTTFKIMIESFTNGEGELYLLDEYGDVIYGTLYSISIGRGSIRVQKCEKVLDIWDSYLAKCDPLKHINLRSIRSDYDSVPHSYNFFYEDGKVVLTETFNELMMILLEWTVTTPENIAFYLMKSSIGDWRISHFNFSNVLSLTSETGTLTSPVIHTSYSGLCLMVKCYIPGTSGPLELFAQVSNSNNTFSIGNISSTGNWKNHRVTADIPEEFQGQPLHIVVRGTKLDSAEMLVKRIVGCNSEENEDVAVFLDRGDDRVFHIGSTGFDLAPPTGSVLHRSENCYNGAFLDSSNSKCICQAGFTGTSCEMGCGPNRYGDDCGGTCSLTANGCKGMLLCRPHMNCDCAPGYKGPLCQESCNDGEYGVGCKQVCGKCGLGTCDIYTGTCTEDCQPGYIAPLCHKTYKYLASPPEVSVKDFHSLKIVTNVKHMLATGNPRFLEIQIKKDHIYAMWSELEVTQLDTNIEEVTTNISGLLAGKEYKVRAVVIDEDGNSYRGDLVPVTTVVTKCTVPPPKFGRVLQAPCPNCLEIEWQLEPEVTWCPVLHYEVYVRESWRWHLHSKVQSPHVQINNLLPGTRYKVKLRAVTVNGPSAFSPVYSLTTASKSPWYVTSLKAVPLNASSLIVSWDEPFNPSGEPLTYSITYKCIRVLACADIDACSYDDEDISTNMTRVVLQDLQPHTQYQIRVAGVGDVKGPTTSVYAVTNYSDPGVSPVLGTESAVQRTNSSLQFHWGNPMVCQHYNGYFKGYKYILVHSEHLFAVTEGTTLAESMLFENLNPNTEYVLRVFVLSSGGWNIDLPLDIPGVTTCTVPEPVDNLAVYKSGRKFLGLRWDLPKRMYGQLKSFKLEYGPTNANRSVTTELDPSSCSAWPTQFCHTVTHLLPNRQYFVRIRVQTTEINETGDPKEIVHSTGESAPDAPSFLKLVNQTTTGLTVEWGIPTMLNGVLRTFVVNLEETESLNSTECCEYFPLQEVPVKQESPSYYHTFAGLRPASKYIISISGKTVALGQALSITAVTRPERPTFQHPPETFQSSFFEPTVRVYPANDQGSLMTGYILVVIPTSDGELEREGEMWDNDLVLQLQQFVNSTFYIAAEIINLTNAEDILIGTGKEAFSGQFGVVEDRALVPGKTYRVGWVAVIDYFGARTLGYAQSDEFLN